MTAEVLAVLSNAPTALILLYIIFHNDKQNEAREKALIDNFKELNNSIVDLKDTIVEMKYRRTIK